MENSFAERQPKEKISCCQQRNFFLPPWRSFSIAVRTDHSYGCPRTYRPYSYSPDTVTDALGSRYHTLPVGGHRLIYGVPRSRQNLKNRQKLRLGGHNPQTLRPWINYPVRSLTHSAQGIVRYRKGNYRLINDDARSRQNGKNRQKTRLGGLNPQTL